MTIATLPHSRTDFSPAPDSPPVIELLNVSKSFGQKTVLSNLTLRVPAGKTYAFLGRNGAGKTSAIRMLMGLLRPDSGQVRVLGIDPRKDPIAVRRAAGYLAEDQQMWGWMKIAELLRFMAPFYPTWDMPLAQDLLRQWELSPTAKIRHLSKGQNVRLGLLLALAHRPQIMILDDPALGLDPIMRQDFLRSVVTHMQANHITVFFSSHLLYEVEPVADLVGILHRGSLAVESDTESLRDRVKRLLLPLSAYPHVATLPNILDFRQDTHRLALTVADAPAALTQLAALDLHPEVIDLNLDEIFAAYVVGQSKLPAQPPTAAIPT